MNIKMCSLLILLYLLYMVEAKALHTYEDGTDNGGSYNYILENYLTENPGIHNDLHRHYTGNLMYENRYVPQIDGHPIFIPSLSSNQYKTVNTRFYSKKKMLPKHYWSTNRQNVRLLPEQVLDSEHISHISRVPTENEDLSHITLLHNSPQKKVNTQLKKSYPVPNKGIGEKDYIQKYSYGNRLKDAVYKQTKTSNQIPESHPMNLNDYNIDKSKLQSLGKSNIKYDETRINSDYALNHIDNSYDDPIVVESRHVGPYGISSDYPKAVEDWRETLKVENYYKPIITEKLIKENPFEDYKPIITEKLIQENPIEDFYDPVLKQDLSVKNLGKGFEKPSYPNFNSLENEALINKEIVKSNSLKDSPGESELTKKITHLHSNKKEETNKFSVKDNYDYDEPHVIKVSKHKSPIKQELSTETKFMKTKQSHGEILGTISDYPVDTLSEKNQIEEDKAPLEIKALTRKPVVEYDDQTKTEAKKKYGEYSEHNAIVEREQFEDSDIMENSINHDLIIKKKGEASYLEDPVTVVSFINYSKPNKKTSSEVKGDSAHHVKAKGDSAHHVKAKGDSAHHVKAKGDSAHHIKAKGDSAHHIKAKGDSVHHIKAKGDSAHHIKAEGDAKDQIKTGDKHINNYPHLGVPSKNYNQDYEFLDKDQTILSNVPDTDLEVELEDAENVPFELGSGVIQERDSGRDSRNLFSDSGIWSQMVNFHAQERNKFKKCITPKNETGNCMPIQLCPDPNIFLNLDDLIKQVCSIDEVFRGICCPEFSAETLKVDWEDFNSESSEQVNVEEIKSTVACGQTVSSGEDVLSWPWMAPLISASTRRIFCGGVLINEQYVLTAAHCTRRVPRNQILVILGSINARQEPPNQEFTVVEIKRHARYNPRTMHNDIALLKLSKPVPMGDFRRFICLPTEKETFVGHKAVMLGWQGSFAITKNVELLRVLPKEECRNNLGEDTLCTEPRIEDSMCNLDSGAPLIIQKDGSYEVIGILTWDRNDCDSRFPAIFTNVSHFQKWIEVHSSS